MAHEPQLGESGRESDLRHEDVIRLERRDRENAISLSARQPSSRATDAVAGGT